MVTSNVDVILPDEGVCADCDQLFKKSLLICADSGVEVSVCLVHPNGNCKEYFCHSCWEGESE